MDALDADGVESRPLWKPMHMQPLFKDNPAYVTGCAERLFRQCVTLPSGSAHGDEDIERVCSAISAYVQGVRL